MSQFTRPPRPMRPMVSGPQGRHFRGFGAAPGATAAGVTGAVAGPVPAGSGGNAIQGQGIFFTYATAPISLAHAAVSPATPIQFDANSVFVWLRSTFVATLAGAAQTLTTLVQPNINVQIQDTGKGSSFMNTPVPLTQLASNNPGLPYVLPIPQLIQANASFSWTFTSFEAADDYTNLQFQLHGFRVFNPNISDMSQLFV